MPYTDRNLTCVDCSTSFVFSADDQEFHAQKGYTNDPKRCPTCRAARRSDSGGGSYSSGGGYGQREMTSVICSQCGKQTQVPFVPRNDRPVYCSDCFATQRPSSGGRSRY